MKPPVLKSRTHLFVWAALKEEKGGALVKVQALLPDEGYWPYSPKQFQNGIQKCDDLLSSATGNPFYKEASCIRATIDGFSVCFETERKGEVTDEGLHELLSAFSDAVTQRMQDGGRKPPRLYTSENKTVTAGAGVVYESRAVDSGLSFKVRLVVPAYTRPSAFDTFARGSVDRVRKGLSPRRDYDINTYSRSPNGNLVVQGTLKGFSEESAVAVLGRFFAQAHSHYFA